MGKEIFAAMCGIDKRVLENEERLEEILRMAARKEDYRLVRPEVYEFDQVRVVGARYEGSHIILKVCPSQGAVIVNIHSESENGCKAFDYVKESFGPKHCEYIEREVQSASGYLC